MGAGGAGSRAVRVRVLRAGARCAPGDPCARSGLSGLASPVNIRTRCRLPAASAAFVQPPFIQAAPMLFNDVDVSASCRLVCVSLLAEVRRLQRVMCRAFGKPFTLRKLEKPQSLER